MSLTVEMYQAILDRGGLVVCQAGNLTWWYYQGMRGFESVMGEREFSRHDLPYIVDYYAPAYTLDELVAGGAQPNDLVVHGNWSGRTCSVLHAYGLRTSDLASWNLVHTATIPQYSIPKDEITLHKAAPVSDHLVDALKYMLTATPDEGMTASEWDALRATMAEPQQCSCDIVSLLKQGCQCGGV